MPLLNPSLKLIAISLIMNLGNLERRMVWLTRVYGQDEFDRQSQTQGRVRGPTQDLGAELL